MTDNIEKVYLEAKDIYQDLDELIREARSEFVAIGTSFDRSLKHCRPALTERMEQGVDFTYIHLSRQSDFSLFAPQFGQSSAELRDEVVATHTLLRRLRDQYPERIRNYPTKRCPNYRMYVADPDSESPSGIIVFYGSATDSPLLPAYRVTNFRQNPWRLYLEDFRRYLESTENRRVFLIHGHGEAQWRALSSILTGLKLETVVLQEEPGRGRTMIEKFLEVARSCIFSIAVFTPDDMIQFEKSGETDRYFQPRPNAIFELGWFVGTLGRERALVIAQEDVQTFSDFYGVEILTYRDKIEEVYLKLERELRSHEIIFDPD